MLLLEKYALHWRRWILRTNISVAAHGRRTISFARPDGSALTAGASSHACRQHHRAGLASLANFAVDALKHNRNECDLAFTLRHTSQRWISSSRPPKGERGGGGGGGGDAAVAGRSVYVGNLTYEVVWQDLKDHMRAAGDVLHARVLTMHDGRSKGCGVVEYASADAASRAIAELHDSELMGRQIFVREDREESRSMVTAVGGGGGVVVGGGGERGGRGGGRDAAAAAAAAAGRSVYVGNLAYEVAWQDLKDHMRAAGDVLHAKVLTMQDGRSKGCGVVEYASADAAFRAIAELHDSELMGRQIFVREDRERGSKNGIVSRRTTVMDQVKRAEFYALNQR